MKPEKKNGATLDVLNNPSDLLEALKAARNSLKHSRVIVQALEEVIACVESAFPNLNEQQAPREGKPKDRRRQLSADQVRDIRAQHSKGVLPKEIAESYGIRPTQVRNIVLRRAWRDIP
jgi:hypothetical protein